MSGMSDRFSQRLSSSSNAMLWLLARPAALACALFQPMAWGEATGFEAAIAQANPAPAEGLVTSISSIKRLDDGTLSCAQLKSRIEVLRDLSAEGGRQAAAMMSGVEQAQAELRASTTISQAPGSSGFAVAAAITALEAIPLAGNAASSLIAPSYPLPSLQPPAAQTQVSALKAMLDAGKAQAAQFATASRLAHLRQLHARSHCAGQSE